MERVHERDVKDALAHVMLRYPRGTRFQYEPVEPSAGAPARLWVFDEEGRRTSFPGLDHGMLGWSRKEALRTLLGIKAGMEAQRVMQGETVRHARRLIESRFPQSDIYAKLDELTAGF